MKAFCNRCFFDFWWVCGAKGNEKNDAKRASGGRVSWKNACDALRRQTFVDDSSTTQAKNAATQRLDAINTTTKESEAEARRKEAEATAAEADARKKEAEALAREAEARIKDADAKAQRAELRRCKSSGPNPTGSAPR